MKPILLYIFACITLFFFSQYQIHHEPRTCLLATSVPSSAYRPGNILPDSLSPRKRRGPHKPDSIGTSYSPSYSKSQSVSPNPIKALYQHPQSAYTHIAKLIGYYEKYSATVYRCAAGKRTIGFGTVLAKSDKRTQISYQDALQAKRDRITRDYNVLIRYTSRDTALIMTSFAYNCGLEAALRIVKQKAYHKIPLYCYARGVRLKGLVKRRAEEYSLIKHGLS